jgi:type I restriction enzyme S subunit
MGNEREFKDLPEGWKWVRLGEVIENTYPGEWGDNPTDNTDNKNIFPVFSTLAIDYDGRIDFTKAVPRKLNKKKIEKLKLKKGMILIEKSGGSTDTPAGKVAILKQDFEGTCSNFIQILKPNNNTCNSCYLFYRLLYNFKNNLIEKYQQRTTGIINFILKDYFNEYISLPPLPEQQKIAEILETVDNAIEKTDKIIEKYKRIKQGLMQDLLTKGIDENGNIRDEKTHKFKDSPLGRIPEEWEVVRLGEVGEIIMGQSPASALVNQEGNGIPFLQGSAEFGLKYPLPKNWIVKPLKTAPIGSILISVRAPVGDINIANNVYGIGRGLSAIKINDSKVNNLFIWYNIYFYRNELVKISQGSTFEAVGYKELNNFLIPLPPLPEQQRIAEILSQIDKTIEKEEQYKEKLKRLKQGLMEDLLTGKVRVNHLVEEEEK